MKRDRKGTQGTKAASLDSSGSNNYWDETNDGGYFSEKQHNNNGVGTSSVKKDSMFAPETDGSNDSDGSVLLNSYDFDEVC